MSSYKKYTQDVIITGITNLVLVARGIILLPLITKLLGAADYGKWTQVVVTLSLLAPALSLNLGGSLARFLPTDKTKEEIGESFYSVFFVALALSLLVAATGYGLAGPLTRFLFSGTESASLVRIMMFVIPLWVLDIICLGFFRGLVQIKSHAFFNVVRDFSEVGFVSLFVYSGLGIKGALFGLIASRLLTNSVMLGIIISKIGIKLPRFSKLRAYLRFGLPLLPGMLASWVVNAGDRYVITIFLGLSAVGIYSAGYSIGNVITFFLAPLSLILLPTLSKAYAENKREVEVYLAYSLKFFLMLAVPSALGLTVLAQQLLRALSTPDFVSVGSRVIPVIAAGYLIFGIYVIYSQVLILVKKTAAFSILWTSIAVLNLGLNIAVVPRFGAVSAAWTTLFCYILAAVIVYVYSRTFIRFDANPVFLVKSVIASLVMALVIWALKPEGLAAILLVIGLGAVVYFGVLVLLRGFSQKEITFFRQLLP